MNNSPQQPKINIDVNTNPNVFNQTNNNPVPKSEVVESIYTIPKKFLPQGTGNSNFSKNPQKKKTVWIILIISVAILLLVLAAALVYIFQQSSVVKETATNNTTVNNAVVPVTNNNNAVNNTNNTASANNDSAVTNAPLNSNVPEVNGELAENINEELFATNNANISLTVPVDNSAIPDTADSDGDRLTDEEENHVFTTKDTLPDTDQDGYLDGGEVKSLYSPLKAKQTLLKSGLVIEEKNKDFGWSIYYPAEWLVEPLDDAKREIIFTPDRVDTEFVEVMIQDNAKNQSAAEWYASQYQDLQVADVDKVTVGGLNGIVSADGFTYYLADEHYIIGLIYNIGNSKQAHFRTTFTMMVNSFIYTPPKKKTTDTNKTN